MFILELILSILCGGLIGLIIVLVSHIRAVHKGLSHPIDWELMSRKAKMIYHLRKTNKNHYKRRRRILGDSNDIMNAVLGKC